MSRMPWNAFKTKHKKYFCFSASVSPQISPGQHFDKNKKKLPTPYGLFQEWLSKNLAGDWSSIKVTGGFIVIVATDSDNVLITKKFSVIGVVKSRVSNKTQQLHYQDSNYSSLSKELGYVL